MIYDECHTTIGCLRFIFHENNGALQRVILTDHLWNAISAEQVVKRSKELGKSVSHQIHEYLHGHRRQFDLFFDLTGTPFQKQVWESLTKIPYGETRTYSQIAESIGRNSRFARATGSAISHNPLPLIIPCHRVIGIHHTLTGYVGGLEMKRQLLHIEGVRLR